MVSTKTQAAEPCGDAAGARLGGRITKTAFLSKQEGQRVEGSTSSEDMDGSVSLLAGCVSAPCCLTATVMK